MPSEMKLLPCPNPGCEKSDPEIRESIFTVFVKCLGCGMQGPGSVAGDDDEAEQRWNALPRATPDASIPLARMLADAVKEDRIADGRLDTLRSAERFQAAVETGSAVTRLLATIDALPALSVADQIAIVVCGAKETVIDTKAKYHNGCSGLACGILVVILTSDNEAHLIVDGVPDAIPGTTNLSPPVAAMARATWERLKEKQG